MESPTLDVKSQRNSPKGGILIVIGFSFMYCKGTQNISPAQ